MDQERQAASATPFDANAKADYPGELQVAAGESVSSSLPQPPHARQTETARRIELKVPARATKSSHASVATGAPCEVLATLGGRTIERIVLSCAGRQLYDSRARSAGAEPNSVLYEVEGKQDGAYAYKLTFSDRGAGATQLTLNTLTQRGLLVLGAGRVELRLGDKTLDRFGPSLFNLPSNVYRQRHHLKRASAVGQYPRPLASPCSMSVQLTMASSSGLICGAQLMCRGRTLYGLGKAPGTGKCQVEDGRIVRFEDAHGSSEDGTPTLSYATERGQARLADSASNATYEAVFDQAY